MFDEALFRQQWADGVRVVEMAETHGVSTGAISHRARRLGLPSRQRGRKPRQGRPSTPPRPDLHALTGGRWVPNHRGIQQWVTA